jgi:hypothetical protein
MASIFLIKMRYLTVILRRAAGVFGNITEPINSFTRKLNTCVDWLEDPDFMFSINQKKWCMTETDAERDEIRAEHRHRRRDPNHIPARETYLWILEQILLLENANDMYRELIYLTRRGVLSIDWLFDPDQQEEQPPDPHPKPRQLRRLIEEELMEEPEPPPGIPYEWLEKPDYSQEMHQEIIHYLLSTDEFKQGKADEAVIELEKEDDSLETAKTLAKQFRLELYAHNIALERLGPADTRGEKQAEEEKKIQRLYHRAKVIQIELLIDKI